LLLAIYYSRISLAVLLRFRLNNPFFVVQGVCSSLRYSIYKVHPAILPKPTAPFIGQLAYDTTLFFICQAFSFKKLKKFRDLEKGP